VLANVVKVSNSQPLYTKKASREVMIGTVEELVSDIHFRHLNIYTSLPSPIPARARAALRAPEGEGRLNQSYSIRFESFPRVLPAASLPFFIYFDVIRTTICFFWLLI
jgi:hypothetical protein